MINLHVLRTGSGPQILMLHGIGGSATSWDKLTHRLASDFTCLAPDLPGYGDSPPTTNEGLLAITGPVAKLLEGQPTHVIGVSFGALLALSLARNYPQLVRSLVLADATLGRAYMGIEERTQWLEKRRALSQTLQLVSRQRAAEIAAPNASAEIIEEIAHHMRRAGPEGYMAVAQTIASEDARPWLKDISKPALVLCGEADLVTGPEVSKVLAESLPNAVQGTIPMAGHAPHIEQPDIFAQMVRNFLGGLS